MTAKTILQTVRIALMTLTLVHLLSGVFFDDGGRDPDAGARIGLILEDLP